jgi:preprotein translocase subunit SecG
VRPHNRSRFQPSPADFSFASEKYGIWVEKKINTPYKQAHRVIRRIKLNMETLILTIHILIALALVAVVLLQRSEGGGLGIGGGSGGGFMTARGTANLMTRLTTFLAIGFFATTIVLAILAGAGQKPVSIVDEVLKETPAAPSGPTVPTGQ